MLVAVIFLVALLTLSLSVAMPKIAKEIQRDRELETMNRGKQYIRGIKMYYKAFHAYPPNVDALVKPTNNIRFLRKKYADPTTGKEDWKPVLFGQNKAPTAMGFFGQPLGSSSIAGVGPGGTNNGFNPSNPTATSTTDTSAPPVDPNNPNAANNGASGTNSGTGLSGQNGQTFGGAGIIGFSPNSPKPSIMVYKKKNHYNEWEFVYDPIVEQLQQMGAAGGPIGGTNSFSNNSGTVNSNNSNNGPGVVNNNGSNSSGGSGSNSQSNPANQ